MTLVYTGWTVPRKTTVQILKNTYYSTGNFNDNNIQNNHNESEQQQQTSFIKRTQVMSWSYSDSISSNTKVDNNRDGNAKPLCGCCIVTLYTLTSLLLREQKHQQQEQQTKSTEYGNKDNNRCKTIYEEEYSLEFNKEQESDKYENMENSKEREQRVNKIDTDNLGKDNDTFVGVEWELHFLPASELEQREHLSSLSSSSSSYLSTTIATSNISLPERENVFPSMESETNLEVEYKATYRFYGDDYCPTPSTFAGTSGVVFLSSGDVLIHTANARQKLSLSLDRFTLGGYMSLESEEEKEEICEEEQHYCSNKSVEESKGNKSKEIGIYKSNTTRKASLISPAREQSERRYTWIRRANALSISEIIANKNENTKVSLFRQEQYKEEEEEEKEEEEEEKEEKREEERECLLLCTALPKRCVIDSNVIDKRNVQDILFVTATQFDNLEYAKKSSCTNETKCKETASKSPTFCVGVISVKSSIDNKEVTSTLRHFNYIKNNINTNVFISNASLRPSECIWLYIPQWSKLEEKNLLEASKSNSDKLSLATAKEEQQQQHVTAIVSKINSNDNDDANNKIISGSIIAIASSHKELITMVSNTECKESNYYEHQNNIFLYGSRNVFNREHNKAEATKINDSREAWSVSLALSFTNNESVMKRRQCYEENEINKTEYEDVNAHVHRNTVNVCDVDSRNERHNSCTNHSLVHILTYSRNKSFISNNYVTSWNNDNMSVTDRITTITTNNSNNNAIDEKESSEFTEEEEEDETITSTNKLTVLELCVPFIHTPRYDVTEQFAKNISNSSKDVTSGTNNKYSLLDEGLYKLRLSIWQTIDVPFDVLWVNGKPFKQNTYTPHIVEGTNKETKTVDKCTTWRVTPQPQITNYYYNNSNYCKERQTYWCQYTTSALTTLGINNNNNKNKKMSNLEVIVINSPMWSLEEEEEEEEESDNALLSPPESLLTRTSRQVENSHLHEEREHTNKAWQSENTFQSDEIVKNKFVLGLPMLFCTRHTSFVQWLATRAIEQCSVLDEHSTCKKKYTNNEEYFCQSEISITNAMEIARDMLHLLWQYVVEEWEEQEEEQEERFHVNTRKELTLALSLLKQVLHLEAWHINNAFLSSDECTEKIIAEMETKLHRETESTSFSSLTSSPPPTTTILELNSSQVKQLNCMVIMATLKNFACVLHKMYLELLVALDWLAVNSFHTKLLREIVLFYLGINVEKWNRTTETTETRCSPEHNEWMLLLCVLLRIANFNRLVSYNIMICQKDHNENIISSSEMLNKNNNYYHHHELTVELEQWFRRNVLLYVHESKDATVELMLSDLYNNVEQTLTCLTELEAVETEHYKNALSKSKAERLTMEFALLCAVDVNALWRCAEHRLKHHSHLREAFDMADETKGNTLISNNTALCDWHLLLCTCDSDNLQMLYATKSLTDDENNNLVNCNCERSVDDSTNNDDNRRRLSSLFTLMWCIDFAYTLQRQPQNKNGAKEFTKHVSKEGWEEEEEWEEEEYSQKEQKEAELITSMQHRSLSNTIDLLEEQIRESVIRWLTIIVPTTERQLGQEAQFHKFVSNSDLIIHGNRYDGITWATHCLSFPEQWMRFTLNDLNSFPFTIMSPMTGVLVMQTLLCGELTIMSLNSKQQQEQQQIEKVMCVNSRYKLLTTLYESWTALRWLTSDSESCSKVMFTHIHELCVCHKRYRHLPIASFASLLPSHRVMSSCNTSFNDKHHYKLCFRDKKEGNRSYGSRSSNVNVNYGNEERYKRYLSCTRITEREELLVVECVHRLWASATSPMLKLQLHDALRTDKQNDRKQNTTMMPSSSNTEPTSFQCSPFVADTSSSNNNIVATVENVSASAINKNNQNERINKLLLTEHNAVLETLHSDNSACNQFVYVWERVWYARGNDKMITNTVMYEKLLEAVLTVLESCDSNNTYSEYADRLNVSDNIKITCSHYKVSNFILALLRPIYFYCLPRITFKVIQTLSIKDDHIKSNKKNSRLTRIKNEFVQYDACDSTNVNNSDNNNNNNNTNVGFVKLPIEEVCKRIFSTVKQIGELFTHSNNSFNCLTRLTSLQYSLLESLLSRGSSVSLQQQALSRLSLEECHFCEQWQEQKQEECSYDSIWEMLCMSNIQSNRKQINNTKKQVEQLERTLEESQNNHDSKEKERALTFSPSCKVNYFISCLQRNKAKHPNYADKVSSNFENYDNRNDYSKESNNNNNKKNSESENVSHATNLVLIMEALRQELTFFILYDLHSVRWLQMVETLLLEHTGSNANSNTQEKKNVTLEVTSRFVPEDAFNTLASQTESLSRELSVCISEIYDQAIILLILDVMYNIFVRVEEDKTFYTNEAIDDLENEEDCKFSNRSCCYNNNNNQDEGKFDRINTNTREVVHNFGEAREMHTDALGNEKSKDKCNNNTNAKHSVITLTSINVTVQMSSSFVQEMKRCIRFISQNTFRGVPEHIIKSLLCSLTTPYQHFLQKELFASRLDLFICSQQPPPPPEQQHNVYITASNKSLTENKEQRKDDNSNNNNDDDNDNNYNTENEKKEQEWKETNVENETSLLMSKLTTRYVDLPFHAHMRKYIMQNFVQNVDQSANAFNGREKVSNEYLDNHSDNNSNTFAYADKELFSNNNNTIREKKYKDDRRNEPEMRLFEKKPSTEELTVMRFANEWANALWNTENVSMSQLQTHNTSAYEEEEQYIQLAELKNDVDHNTSTIVDDDDNVGVKDANNNISVETSRKDYSKSHELSHVRRNDIMQTTYSSHNIDLLLLVKEEQSRRRRLMNALMSEYHHNIEFNTQDSISVCLQNLYLVLRCERRRRELEYYTLEQKDLILTFCSKLHAQYVSEVRVMLRNVRIAIAEQCAAAFDVLCREEASHRWAMEEEFVCHLGNLRALEQLFATFTRHESETRYEIYEQEDEVRSALVYASCNELNYIKENANREYEWNQEETVSNRYNVNNLPQGEHANDNNSVRADKKEEWTHCQQAERSNVGSQVTLPSEEEYEQWQHGMLQTGSQNEVPNTATGLDLVAEAGANIWHALGKFQTRLRETVAPAPVHGHIAPNQDNDRNTRHTSSLSEQQKLLEHWSVLHLPNVREQRDSANINATTSSGNNLGSWESEALQLSHSNNNNNNSHSNISNNKKDNITDDDDEWEEGWNDDDKEERKENVREADIEKLEFTQNSDDAKLEHNNQSRQTQRQADTLTSMTPSAHYLYSSAEQTSPVNIEKEHTSGNTDNNIYNVNECVWENRDSYSNNNNDSNVVVNKNKVNEKVELISITTTKLKSKAQIANKSQPVKHTQRKILAARIDESCLLQPTTSEPTNSFFEPLTTASTSEAAAHKAVSEENANWESARQICETVENDKHAEEMKKIVESTAASAASALVNSVNEENKELLSCDEMQETSSSNINLTLLHSHIAEIVLAEFHDRNDTCIDEVFERHMLLRQHVLNK